MTRVLSARWLLATVIVAAGACTDAVSLDSRFVAVTEIEVTNEEDSGTFLEVEVHLYEWPSGLFLGCSGEANGMEPVDQSDVAYSVTAYFGRPPSGTGRLTVGELRGLDLFAVVIEDDHEPCPVPTNEGTTDLVTDDLIGESPVFGGGDLDSGVAFSFDNVTWIVLEGIR